MTLIIALICFLVRILFIPNPFYYIFQEIEFYIGSFHVYFHPIFLNLLVEPVIVGITLLAINSLYGRGGDSIVEGAIYFACYALLVAIIYFGTTGYISWTQAL